MGRRHAGCRSPPGARGELKQAYTLAALDPDARPPIPYLAFVDALERKYGQPPGSAATWDAEAFLRAAELMRIESSVSVKRSKH